MNMHQHSFGAQGDKANFAPNEDIAFFNKWRWDIRQDSTARLEVLNDLLHNRV